MVQGASWSGQPSIKGSTESARMALLTASLIGVSFTWGVEMTYCTPYLLQLGLTKSRVSLVWIAGPLSGLIMQPVVGIIADRSTSRWGRRRPFMVAGTAIVSLSLLILGWTKEIVSVFVSDPETRKGVTIGLAVLSIYAVDFAINAVQASCRSLVVDTLPIQKQGLGSAWAARMGAMASIIGYAAGATKLNSIFGNALGDTQFKQLTVIAALALPLAVGITSWAVTERVLISSGKEQEDNSPIQMLTHIFRTATHLPNRIAAICWIQFWAWIGYFPLMFYSTTWIGEIYLRYDAPAEARQSQDTLGQVGRVGSMCLIISSLINFASSIMLPWFVISPEDEKRDFTPRPPASLAPIVAGADKRRPTLLTAWTVSHLVFAGSMLMAPLVSSVRFATVLIAICAVPGAIAGWAPFTFIGIEINRLGSTSNGHAYRRLSTDSLELEASTLHLNHRMDDSHSSTGELSGIYLGILNLFTTLPQFVGTFISWIVFSILEPGKSPELAKEAHPDEHHSTDGPNAIAVCFFIGALSVIVASYATNRLKYIR
ncbi:hypothetical protein H2201_005855 [Coniosporium apollinis]|uniref:Sucrose transporter n=1 Tax=Coniosporium apollinis TaxID=61459 RepID=A0ABQ9NS25_9PEZI|nr:hypothetical protein H2201_005855 [Coniosporium apollinis]